MWRDPPPPPPPHARTHTHFCRKPYHYFKLKEMEKICTPLLSRSSISFLFTFALVLSDPHFPLRQQSCILVHSFLASLSFFSLQQSSALCSLFSPLSLTMYGNCSSACLCAFLLCTFRCVYVTLRVCGCLPARMCALVVVYFITIFHIAGTSP